MAQNGETAAYNPKWLKMVKPQLTSQKWLNMVTTQLPSQNG